MSEREEIVERVVSRVRERFSGERAERVAEFVQQYYGWVAEEELAGRDVEDLYGAAVSHRDLARHRRPGEARVRVYAPRFEEHGWRSAHAVVETVNDDMPFLVDSVSMELNRLGYGIHLIIHPVIRVLRDEQGQLTGVLLDKDEGERAITESFIHVEIDRHTDPQELQEIEDNLCGVLGGVRAAVEDWPQMRERARSIASEMESDLPATVDAEDAAEAGEFLRWIEDNNFTFLGYREYDLTTEGDEEALKAVEGSGLGIMRGGGGISRGFARLTPQARALAHEPYPLNLTKANSRATVHRPSYLDYVGIKRLGEAGEVVGERRFLGLYTFSAYSTSVFDIPIVRRKAEYVLRQAGFPKGSHNEKDLVQILETYPRDELFQISAERLFEISTGILHLQERHRVRLFVRRDDFGRFLSCLVFVPRERYDTPTRQRIQNILLEAFDGESVEFNVRLSESVLARLHFVIYTSPEEPPDYDLTEVEERLAQATQGWDEEFHEELLERCGEERGTGLFSRYRDAFSAGYREDFSPRMAVADVLDLEELGTEEAPRTRLYSRPEDPENSLRFKMFCSGDPIPLSDILPLLENMGIRVIDESGPYCVRTGEKKLWIHNFGLIYGEKVQATEIGELFQEAFIRTWRGQAENDGFNRLVLGARLDWREVAMLRAICKYLRQTGTTFSQPYMEDTLAEHPGISRLLVELFHSRFGPRGRDGKNPEPWIQEALDAVPSLDQDRILRGFLSVVQATLRTNYYQGRDRLSLKLNPGAIPGLPRPLPAYEIFVYSTRTEGVHLRGGKVARGGIRWSDRKEDFRTEILDLMKAQTVKNSVIVPVGAKGGFVVKRPPAGRDALLKEGEECYRTFIRGMLDLTDNLQDGEVVPPPEVVRYDGNDSYLVVAADKGTAAFSDVANAIAEEHGFWLGDAFASGGSTGYDHKKMGITARGAWESVERHLRELSIDPQADDFTVVGVGDMSGDVFGNGMLLSRHIRLVGAFDHRHIFLDPNPDPEASFAERQRLFEMPYSSWADYDESLISRGGGVFPRSAKSIQLSPEVRELLGVEAEEPTPNEVVRAILRARVDLLWNGGVGTYVKAAGESHAEVGDKSNDSSRADAPELRCRAVAEGGNLGLTQRARIEYALGGGRVNTDAIDNSAGADCSDHEVNVKVLLDSVVSDGEMTVKQRNRLLGEMEDEVARLVLGNNREQNLALSNAIAQSASMINVYARYLDELEDEGKLDRGLEFLPDEKALGERRSEGLGLTSPEYAVVMAYTKTLFQEELLASNVPDDPFISEELEGYFPAPLREQFRGRIHGHRLGREISATVLSNEMVNRGGISFAFRLEEDTGAGSPQIARAYAAAREIFGMERMWTQIEGLDAVEAWARTRSFLEARRLVERGSRWLLGKRRPPLDVEAESSHFSEGVAEITGELPELLPDSQQNTLKERAGGLAAAGVPEELAERIAGLGAEFCALDIVEIAESGKYDLTTAGCVYFALGERLELGWLRGHIEALPRQSRWQTLARSALRDDLYDRQAALTAKVLEKSSGEAGVENKIEGWIEENRAQVGRLLGVLDEIQNTGDFDLSTLSVALRELRNLVAGV